VIDTDQILSLVLIVWVLFFRVRTSPYPLPPTFSPLQTQSLITLHTHRLLLGTW